MKKWNNKLFIGLAYHANALSWSDHAWGTFNVGDKAQIILDGAINDLVFPNLIDSKNNG